jgi:hypothetical protein
MIESKDLDFPDILRAVQKDFSSLKQQLLQFAKAKSTYCWSPDLRIGPGDS